MILKPTHAIAGSIIAITATLATATTAQANRGNQPMNCAIYAEEAAKAIDADERVTGATETASVAALDDYAKTMRAVVAKGMDNTYAQSAAFGWDKATVDRKMAEGEVAVRAAFVAPGMKPGTIYTNHLMGLSNCFESSADSGDISAADSQEADGLLMELLGLIR